MKRGALSTLIGRLREAVRPGVDIPADDELLRRWSRHRDEAAFELLVWRHGRLVLGVCQRLLRSPQDVEFVPRPGPPCRWRPRRRPPAPSRRGRCY